MEPILFKVTEKDNHSFHIQQNDSQGLYDRMHYHPEYQISCIINGGGIASVGNGLERFGIGDLFIIGPHVPHVFRREGDGVVRMISVFFREHSFGNRFFLLPEMSRVRSFLSATSRGMKFAPGFAKRMEPLLLDLNKAGGAGRIIGLLTLLREMALSRDWRFLSSVGYSTPPKTEFYYAMNRVFRYISENFDRRITLEEAAKVVNLSKYSFCRYFKKTTHKSFVAYLNEFRVGMACKLLHNHNYSISQIGFRVGFNNLSNFNRQFKRIMKCTPSKYRDLYHKYSIRKS